MRVILWSSISCYLVRPDDASEQLAARFDERQEPR